jgi:hypothetical protein
MYSEPVVLSRIVSKAVSFSSPGEYRQYFDQSLTGNLVDLYESASNSKLFYCNPTLNDIIDVIKKKEDAEGIVNRNKTCLSTSVNIQLHVYSVIRKSIQESFMVG